MYGVDDVEELRDSEPEKLMSVVEFTLLDELIMFNPVEVIAGIVIPAFKVEVPVSNSYFLLL